MSALTDIAADLERARAKHPGRQHGPHEGYAVLLEEVDELWDEVKASKHNLARMRAEAVQVGAMAARFIEDVCDEPERRAVREFIETDGGRRGGRP